MKNDFYEVIVFGWIIQGMPSDWNEFKKAKNARKLLKGLKKEWVATEGKKE